MSSLFQIEADLLEVYQQIEQADGEITEDQEAFLEIKQEEMEKKMNSYRNFIKLNEGSIATCADEIKRIQSFKKTKENLNARLKNNMLQGVNMFGHKDKNGISRLEFTTFKLSTRKTSSVDIDAARLELLTVELDRFLRELTASGITYTAKDVDLSGILASINASVKAQVGDMFKPFVLSDLTNVKVKISSTYTIYHLFQEGEYAIKQLASNDESIMLENATLATDWKLAIGNAEVLKYDPPTIAKIVEGQSLTIK